MQRLTEYVTHHWELVVALAIISFMLFRNLLGPRLAGYRQIGPAEATVLISHEEAVVVDVREEREFKEGHLINAIHIPLGALRGRLGELAKHKERPIIACCRSGNRSASACGMLRKGGFEKVYNLGGGIMAWQNANLPVSKK